MNLSLVRRASCRNGGLCVNAGANVLSLGYRDALLGWAEVHAGDGRTLQGHGLPTETSHGDSARACMQFRWAIGDVAVGAHRNEVRKGRSESLMGDELREREGESSLYSAKSKLLNGSGHSA